MDGIRVAFGENILDFGKENTLYDEVRSLQQLKPPLTLSVSSCRPVVLDVVFQRHALVEESGGGAVNRGAGVQGLHAAHVGALCRSFYCHLHLPPLLWSG